MITGKTQSGFDFELCDEIFDDYTVLENLCTFLETRLNVDFVKFKKSMFKGAASCEKAAEKFLQDENGRVKTSDMIDLVFDIWNSARDLKNS